MNQKTPGTALSAEGLFRLDGMVAVITGAASGIGASVAEHMATQGACLVLGDIDAETLARTAERLGSITTVVTAVVDVTDFRDAQELIAAAGGRVDILVNNAAAPVPLEQFVDTDPQTWQTGLSSLHAAMNCIHSVLPLMKAAGWGRIVNISSTTGTIGTPGMSVYGAAKAGMESLSRGIAKEVAAYGITLNSVAPGVVDTVRQHSRPPEVRQKRLNEIPMHRLASTSEVAAAAVFLASRESGYITGEVLYVDGGQP